MNIAYVRVSTEEQNEARQLEALQKYDIGKWFTEKVSGKDLHRPKLEEMLEFAREGDTIYVHDWSRLSRSTTDLLEVLDRMQAKKINVVSNKEGFDTSTPTGRLMLTMIAAINEFERKNLLERQSEGVAAAKRRGVYKGRKRKKRGAEFASLFDDWQARRKSKSEFAKALGVSRPTLDKMIKEYAQEKRETAQ